MTNELGNAACALAGPDEVAVDEEAIHPAAAARPNESTYFVTARSRSHFGSMVLGHRERQ
jgi:hypothetical protein